MANTNYQYLDSLYNGPAAAYEENFNNLPPEHQAYIEWIRKNHPKLTYSPYYTEILAYQNKEQYIAIDLDLKITYSSRDPAYCLKHGIDTAGKNNQTFTPNLADPNLFKNTTQWLNTHLHKVQTQNFKPTQKTLNQPCTHLRLQKINKGL